ncbi:MAG: phosphotransferase [Rhodospirillales bacterium]|nr:phosphotransferase [Rhodospirillales bacterium]
MDDRKESLERFLKQAAAADRVVISTLTRMPGGAIQDNWLMDAEIEGGPFAGKLAAVVRADPESVPAVSHDRHEEFALLKAAFAAGVTVPEPLWLCDEPTVLERPFFVMRRVGGTAAGHRVVKDAALGGDRNTLARRLGGEELARIHGIRPPRSGCRFSMSPPETPALVAVLTYRRFVDEHGEPRPLLELGPRVVGTQRTTNGNGGALPPGFQDRQLHGRRRRRHRHTRLGVRRLGRPTGGHRLVLRQVAGASARSIGRPAASAHAMISATATASRWQATRSTAPGSLIGR